MRVGLTTLLIIILWAHCTPLHAHDGAVGVVQAKVTPKHVVVLLKLKVKPLLKEVFPEPDGLGATALTTVEGRNKLLDLLARTHSVSTPTALRERDKIERFKPTPSGVWFDIIIKYRCPPPRRQVEVRVETLLEGARHHLTGSFESDGEVTRTILTRRRPSYIFKLAPTSKPSTPVTSGKPNTSSKVFMVLVRHVEFALLPLILLTAVGPRRMRLAGAALVLAPGLVAMISNFVLDGLVYDVLSLLGFSGLCFLILRHHLKRHELGKGDLVLTLAVGLAFCAPLSMSGQSLGMERAEGVFVGAALAVIGVVVGVWLGERAKEREQLLVGWVGMATMVYLAIDTIARLI